MTFRAYPFFTTHVPWKWTFGFRNFYRAACIQSATNVNLYWDPPECAEIKKHMAQQSGVLALVLDEVKRKGGRTEGGWLLWSTANVYVPLLAAAPDGLPAAWQTSSWHQRLLCMNRGVCQKIFVSIHRGKSLQSEVQIRRWPESYWIRLCSSGRDVSMLWHWPMEGQRLASIRCQSHDTSRW